MSQINYVRKDYYKLKIKYNKIIHSLRNRPLCTIVRRIKQTASYVKRGKTWTYIVSRMVNGKSRPIRKDGFRTKKEAQVAASEIESEIHKGFIPNMTKISFSSYFYDWIKFFKNDVGKNSKERYLNTYNTLLESFGDKPIQNINKRDYQAFLNDYAKDRYKATVRKLNSHVRACVQEAIEEGYIRKDFTKGVKFDGLESKRSEEKHLNYHESIKLINHLYQNVQVSKMNHLLLLAVATGMRFGELVGLTRKDFNFKDNTISIDKMWGYTNKMEEGFCDPKTYSAVRVIDVSPKIMSIFNELFENTPDNIHRLVFFSPHSKYKVLSNGAANKALKAILNQLKIDDITVHGLRHTFVSVSIYEEIGIEYISEVIGHKNVETTMKHYVHLLKEKREKDRVKSVKIFDKMIG